MLQAVQEIAFHMMNYFDIIYIIKHIDNISLRILINSVCYTIFASRIDEIQRLSTKNARLNTWIIRLWILTIIHYICLRYRNGERDVFFSHLKWQNISSFRPLTDIPHLRYMCCPIQSEFDRNNNYSRIVWIFFKNCIKWFAFHLVRNINCNTGQQMSPSFVFR